MSDILMSNMDTCIVQVFLHLSVSPTGAIGESLFTYFAS